MGDFLQFIEGTNYITQNGWPTTVWFMLSMNKVGVLTENGTLASGLGEISGTGYARIVQNLPVVAGGVLAFNTMTWQTNTNSDWPPNVYSLIAATTANASGKALCAWNLQPGGISRDMSHPFVFEEVTPTYIS